MNLHHTGQQSPRIFLTKAQGTVRAVLFRGLQGEPIGTWELGSYIENDIEAMLLEKFLGVSTVPHPSLMSHEQIKSAVVGRRE